MSYANCATGTRPSADESCVQACLLCGRPGMIDVFYFPDENSPVAAPPGKTRIIHYYLCQGCGVRRHELFELIEARIESELHASGKI